ncbi:methyltransferase [Actinopolymorpha sp. B17G11]|uniref:methyltransferase n=1 Tax=Actinopolymorpha sp. B17G11 TaxID=3160861 RepID=UPI0032E4D9BA
MKVSTDVLAVLDQATTEGSALRLTGQLDRKLYVSTNKVLQAAGGTWNRKAQAHLFAGDAADAIEQIILTGQITTAQDLGYFPTPPPVVEQLLALADLQPGAEVLEPSAGTGAIAGPLAARGCVVDAVELDTARADVIWNAGYCRNVVPGDFLAMPPAAEYDRVVMNPPFARQADIDHVRHARRFLRPGGLLVSVMASGATFRENRKAAEFRSLVETGDGWFVPLPDGAFVESGTGVRTVIVVIPSAV